MTILVDTNLLVAIVQPAHMHNVIAASSTTRLARAGHRLVIVPQNLYEFWTIVTRPAQVNGLELDTPTARARTIQLKRSFALVGDIPGILGEWERLVVLLHDVKGK